MCGQYKLITCLFTILCFPLNKSAYKAHARLRWYLIFRTATKGTGELQDLAEFAGNVVLDFHLLNDGITGLIRTGEIRALNLKLDANTVTPFIGLYHPTARIRICCSHMNKMPNVFLSELLS